MKRDFVPISPGSEIKLIKLWPHARKQGHSKNDIWQVGRYSKKDGLDVIWLVDPEGNYRWTIDHEFLYQHFEILRRSPTKSFY